MRAVVEVEEIQNRQCLVVTELPYQANPDNLAQKIADLVKDGKIGGIADVRDETSSRTGQRLVIVLKRDAVAKVVLNNLYKHTDLQTNFGANMLALVDGVPRTLSLDAFIRHWVTHQIEVIVRRTQFRLRKAEERAHILRGLLKALDAIDEVIALIRRSDTVEIAREGLMGLLEIDEIQANAILEMQLRRLAALERQKIVAEHDELQAKINEYNAILASPERQRQIISEELAAIVEKFGDDRRSKLVPFDGDMSIEDLIAEEDIVVTITRGGYVKRTKTDDYRSQKRGGKGVRGTKLKEDDIVDHFFVSTTHHWLLFFTNKGRVYRAKAYELPDAGRDARGQHVANLLAFQPDEQIAEILAIRDYEAAPYLVLATKGGLVKKTPLKDYDSPALGRRHRDQPPGDGGRQRRRADRRRAGLGRGRSAADQQEGAVDPVHRDGRRAAPDGPCHLGREGHEFPRGRRAALDECRPARYVRVHCHRRRVREADRRRRVPRPGSRRPRYQGRQDRGGPRFARRRAGGRGDGRDPRHHARRRCDSYASQRGQGDGP